MGICKTPCLGGDETEIGSAISLKLIQEQQNWGLIITDDLAVSLIVVG